MALRVQFMYWNLAAAEHDRGMTKIAAYIKRGGAKLVLLSEIDRNTARSGWVDQPVRLSELTGLPYSVFVGRDWGGGQVGKAVLSAYPLGPPTDHKVAGFIVPEPILEGFILQTNVVVNGMAHVVFVNHFSYHNPCYRLLTARRQSSLVAGLAGNTPVLMGGDLNDVRTSQAVRELSTTLTEVVGPDPGSIDFLFFRGPYQVVRVQSCCDPWDLGPPGGPSDHPFILAELEDTRVNVAQFVRQAVPEGVSSGETFRVSITVRNVGRSTWTGGGGNPYRLGSQNPQDNTRWGPRRADLPASVAPGSEVTFDFEGRAPVTAISRLFNFQWRMVQEPVEWFGDYTPNVRILVEGAEA
jgi:hypothetical protein